MTPSFLYATFCLPIGRRTQNLNLYAVGRQRVPCSVVGTMARSDSAVTAGAFILVVGPERNVYGTCTSFN